MLAFSTFPQFLAYSRKLVNNMFRFWWSWKGGYNGPVSESFQKFVEDSEPKNFGYQDYAHRFTAQLWQPNDWASIFARSGAQYVVLTSKHHEGFCNWDSRNLPHTWNWNAMDVGPRRDLVGDLAKAVKNTTSDFTQQKLHFGLYHSLFEWYNPMYREDADNNFTTNHFAKDKVSLSVSMDIMSEEPENGSDILINLTSPTYALSVHS